MAWLSNKGQTTSKSNHMMGVVLNFFLKAPGRVSHILAYQSDREKQSLNLIREGREVPGGLVATPHASADMERK